MLFLNDFIKALRKARREKSVSVIDDLIGDWHAYAELETIPGFRKSVWKSAAEKKEGPSWKEFKESLKSCAKR